MEGEAILRMWRSQVWWLGRGFVGLAQLERPEQAEFEAGEQQGGAGLEGAGGGVMQDAQQHKGDQRDIDLDLDGVFAAPPEAADLEVLLEPVRSPSAVCRAGRSRWPGAPDRWSTDRAARRGRRL